MKKLILALIIFGFALDMQGQETKIKDIDIDIENNKVFINYDFLSEDTSSKHFVELFFIDEQYNVNLPQTLSGDIGKDISPGLNKRIEWDVFRDDISISHKLQAKIVVDGIQKGGPKNALYSILVPGLGDYFVKDQKEMIIKPYMRTAAILGLTSLGIIANQNRERVPTYSPGYEYSGWRYYSDDPNPELTQLEDGYEYDYWLFKNDTEIFLISGIALWVADIIWVYSKGTENERLKMYSSFNFSASMNKEGASFGLKYTF